MVRRDLAPEPVLVAPIIDLRSFAPPLALVAGALGEGFPEGCGEPPTAFELGVSSVARRARLLLGQWFTVVVVGCCSSQVVSKRLRRGAQPVRLWNSSELTRSERISGSAR